MHALCVIALAGFPAIFSACERGEDPDARPRNYRTVEEVLERRREFLMNHKGVVGTGIGTDSESVEGAIGPKDERHVIVVYLQSAEAEAEVPDDMGGVPIRTIVTGEFRAK